jgi:hypothetical protein
MDIYFLMEDTTACPICRKKMRTMKAENMYLPSAEKTSTFFERTCSGPNHSVQFFTDVETKLVDVLKFSLDHKYSRYLEIDYINKRCRIFCMKNGDAKYIYINKMVEPDFPDLDKLKERIATYVLFS